MPTFPDFENELKAIDPRLTIVLNPNRAGIANIKLSGVDVCPIPSDFIKEEPDPMYVITFPNGYIAKHKSRREALALVNTTLESIKTKEGGDIFFDRE
jgi:hypothetical protein